jgi:hypothetical protein
MVILHFFGFGDSLRQFELEQFTGLSISGFRPLVLDEILVWSHQIAEQKQWNKLDINRLVIKNWFKQAEDIHRWQNTLRTMPEEMGLVAGLGDRTQWQNHLESMLRRQGRNRDDID